MRDDFSFDIIMLANFLTILYDVRDITCMCFTFAAAPGPRGRGVRADEIRAYPTVTIMHIRAWSIGKLTILLSDMVLG
jgi:hypothetical protein